MNGKTAKLLNRYALTKGKSAEDLKKHWQSLTAAQRFAHRQEILKEIQEKSGSTKGKK
ncbi:MAG: hypothetical protein H3C43_10020 [Leptonema sp. (in: Bacteria)]|nr:hypothetical protein [Leptonema sp. (in: bacteria)]